MGRLRSAVAAVSRAVEGASDAELGRIGRGIDGVLARLEEHVEALWR